MLFPEQSSPETSDHNSYLVFARKYRPQSFQQLIGQKHLIDTLMNAFENDRIGHAYILTGVRGVGKTTTARIIAKGLNCLDQNRPTINPCGKCANCISITNGKNIDVFEMDAASRTGIDDIREIIDSIPYKPLNGRFKVYIIDEVHMLSKQAFNGLLKTLEEPPEHVKFIFATTEIHKILPTVLSRCQRIDLKRVSIGDLIEFFKIILDAENIEYDNHALAKIASNADGSVRDGLSLLDQAVAMCNGHLSIDTITEMLGGTQNNEIIDILNHCLIHQPQQALTKFHDMYKKGLDCSLFMQELLRITELLVRIKFTPESVNDPSLDEVFIENIKKIAAATDVHLLSRIWEIALKGIQDIKIAPSPDAVCEMTIIRMNYGVNLPDPSMMIKDIANSSPTGDTSSNTSQSYTEENQAQEKKKTLDKIDTIQALSDLLSHHKHLDIKQIIEVKCSIQHFENGHIDLGPVSGYDVSRKDILALTNILNQLTGQNWQVEYHATSNNVSQDTIQSLRDQKKASQQQHIQQAYQDPIIQSIMENIPGAKVTNIIDAMTLPELEDLLEEN